MQINTYKHIILLIIILSRGNKNMSNTSNGPAAKGSKYWMQKIVNNNIALNNITNNCLNFIWLSPLKANNYKELKTPKIFFNGEYLRMKLMKCWNNQKFWPSNHPSWDAVGIKTKPDKTQTLYLFEAKGHINETKSKCTAKDPDSIKTIKNSLEYTHDLINKNHNYDENVWLDQYYQLGNRLATLEYLKEKGIDVILVLLNIVDDATHIRTSEDDWKKHYEKVFYKMIGNKTPPINVIMIYI